MRGCDCAGRAAGATGAAIRLSKGEDVVVRDSRAAAGTDAFVEATDAPLAGRESVW